MSNFFIYLQLGFQHIADWEAYDHILFILALCAAYQPSQWRNMLILVTAFTLGHSLTLALAVLQWIEMDSYWIELCIPITIVLTSIFNFFQNAETFSKRRFHLNYAIAFGFGWIHGLGFSNYLRMLLGKEASILQPLFAFNLGLEIGQLLIVGIIFACMYLFLNQFKLRYDFWKWTISGITAIMGLMLVFERLG